MIRRLFNRANVTSSQKGDTIVEVTLALTILALVLGTSTVLANRNTKTLQNAQEKNIAVRYAQEQLEFLKTRVVANPTIISSAPARFCMLGANTDPVNADTDTRCNVTNEAATYQRVITMQPTIPGNNQLYNAKATIKWETMTSWLDASGNIQNKGDVQLTYRVYTKLGAVRAPSIEVCGPNLVWTPAGCKPAPKVTLTATPSSVAAGGSSTLVWSSENVTACEASWAGVLASETSGAVNTSGTKTVSPASPTTYTITCTGAVAGSATASALVTIAAPPRPPRMPLYSCHQFNFHVPTPHPYKSNHVYTTNINDCDGNGYGSGIYPVDENGQPKPIGYVPYNTNAGAVSMYGGFNIDQWDDFYTTDYTEYYNAHVLYGYTGNSRTRFYVYPYNNGCSVGGTVPLYRWYSAVVGNHVYIPNTGNPNGWSPQDGGGTFTYEGIAACIFSGP